VIVEIGGGFGGLAYHLFKDYNIKYTYVGFDIPEICIIAQYFLIANFPDKKFLFYSDLKLKEVNINEYDIIIMPNYEIKNLPDKCCDLVFNSHSMTEMNSSTVKEYLLQISRINKKYFLHANHELGYEYNSPSGGKKNVIDLNKSEFELNKNEYKILYKFPELLMNTYYENYMTNTYFEYLYERIDS